MQVDLKQGNKSIEYKLVVFGSAWDVYTHAFRDIIENPSCQYLTPFSQIGWRGYLQRFLFNPRWSKWIPAKWKTSWTKYYTSNLHDQHYCFVILENWLRIESNTQLLPYLHQSFPHAYIVCYLQDLLTRTIDQYTHEPISIDYLKQYTHLILSYDRNDVEKYHVHYAPTVYSPIALNAIKPAEACDLYFLGTDKGRLDLLVDICREMEKRSMTCQFYVIGLPKSKQIKQKGMYYPSHPLSYAQNIQHIAAANCVLELLQANAQSETFRTWECIMMNKKLLTNNDSIKDSAWYDKQYISTFNDLSDINWEFIASHKQPWTENPYKALITPNTLLEKIEQLLQIRIDYK